MQRKRTIRLSGIIIYTTSACIFVPGRFPACCLSRQCRPAASAFIAAAHEPNRRLACCFVCREEEAQEEELAHREDLASAGSTDVAAVLRGETRLTQASQGLLLLVLVSSEGRRSREIFALEWKPCDAKLEMQAGHLCCRWRRRGRGFWMCRR